MYRYIKSVKYIKKYKYLVRFCYTDKTAIRIHSHDLLTDKNENVYIALHPFGINLNNDKLVTELTLSTS